MRAYDIIDLKRKGKELSAEQLQFFVDGFVKGDIPDYQVSAWLMAVCCNGMTEKETAILTEIMAHSGDMIDLSRFGDKTVDKHSTGGIGDKTSLIITPIVASLGCKVAKMSGRGLGYTGGTVDKLEAIPGYRTVMSPCEFMESVENTGMAIISQSGNIAPADKKLYALRDVTATVESIPLITSSIMSKKLAAGAKSIVLDVKMGSGAFMKNPDDAQNLAASMVNIGKHLGRKVSALITNMDTPLGCAVGNSLEVIEAVNVLKGKVKGELYEICVMLAAEMTSLALNVPVSEALILVEDSISTGKAFEKMCEWVENQGGDIRYLKDTSLFRKSAFEYELKTSKTGYIKAVNAESIGKAGIALGAGRITKDDKIDLSAGIILNKKIGDKLDNGDILCTLYSNRKSSLAEAREIIESAFITDVNPPEKQPLVYKIIR